MNDRYYFIFFIFSALISLQQIHADIPNFIPPKHSHVTNTIKMEWETLVKTGVNENFIRKGCPTIRLNPANMPNLYAVCSRLTGKLDMAMPSIVIVKRNYITTIASFLHLDFQCRAFAVGIKQKDRCLSFICLGVDLLENLTDAELETIVAHELMRIKHNHFIKTALVYSLVGTLSATIMYLIDWKLPISFTVIAAFLTQGYATQADIQAGLLTEKPRDLANALYKFVLIRANKLTLAKWLLSWVSFNPLLRTRQKNLDALAKAMDEASQTNMLSQDDVLQENSEITALATNLA